MKAIQYDRDIRLKILVQGLVLLGTTRIVQCFKRDHPVTDTKTAIALYMQALISLKKVTGRTGSRVTHAFVTPRAQKHANIVSSRDMTM